MTKVTADQVAFKDYMKEFDGDPIELLQYVTDWMNENLVINDVFEGAEYSYISDTGE